MGRLFKRAYSYLRAAKLFLDEVESYYSESAAFNLSAFNRLVINLTHEIFAGQPVTNGCPRIRRLFATAITPDGSSATWTQ
ncbi:MAG: hypothetical protein RQM92_12735 [Candidatus Syntrophopropionicum ammoniitolerans]